MFLSINALKVEIVQVTPIRQNCMVVFHDTLKKGIVTDPGGDLPLIIQAIEKNNIEVEAILLTHGHFDHVGATMALHTYLQDKYKKDIPIWGPCCEDQFLLDHVEQSWEYFNMVDPAVRNVTSMRFFQDGEILTFSGMTFEVIHVPGHTPGHVVLFELTARFMITGDVLFKGTIGRSDFPYGNENQLIQGIKDKLLPKGDDVYVLPGHGISSTIGYEKVNNPFLQ